MPLTALLRFDTATALGIWTLTETEAELTALAPTWLRTGGLPTHLTHTPRRREWLAGRVLVAEVVAALTGQSAEATPAVVPDAFGRPRLLDVSAGVALSHGGGCAAALVALGPGRRCGIDVEPVRAKALTLARRFLSPEELPIGGADVARAALAWSAKESLYKAYGRRQLDFRQHLHLRLADLPTPPAALPETGRLYGRITQPATGRQWWHDVEYLFRADGALLTWCVTPAPGG